MHDAFLSSDDIAVAAILSRKVDDTRGASNIVGQSQGLRDTLGMHEHLGAGVVFLCPPDKCFADAGMSRTEAIVEIEGFFRQLFSNMAAEIGIRHKVDFLLRHGGHNPLSVG
ncbi:hypothetical protein SDC9_199980 [bioreactor metagenome]|uniref:Uncharacterized protein n=1 Tax=bioreactor metagenome TaxID=1076179 RepID=A0A645IV91_9ZZZZ